jgi:CBS domain-containing protein
MLDEALVTAGDLMTRNVAVVHPDTSLLEAVTLMAKRQISGMPVVDANGNLVGMLSEGDLVRWHEGYTERETHWLEMLAEGTNLAPEFLQGIREQRHKVKSVMAHNVTTATEDTPAREIARLMRDKSIKRVPVMRDGKVVGIVARSDLVRALAEMLVEKPPELAPHPDVNVNAALRRGRGQTGA